MRRRQIGPVVQFRVPSFSLFPVEVVNMVQAHVVTRLCVMWVWCLELGTDVAEGFDVNSTACIAYTFVNKTLKKNLPSPVPIPIPISIIPRWISSISIIQAHPLSQRSIPRRSPRIIRHWFRKSRPISRRSSHPRS
jgi:hypothetical protein